MTLRSARRWSFAVALTLAVLTGCPHNPDRASLSTTLAPTGDTVAAEAGAAQTAGVEHAHKPAPPKGGPLPPQRVVEPVQLDRSCRVDADCVIEDLGSCCGALPSCVNRDRPADPAAVKAECEKTGQPAHCARRVPDRCACRQGQCVAAGGSPVAGAVVDDAPSAPEPVR